ncbi:unnamed protein product [Acanthoscelides obtectus]|uniref:Uncharacterized protein n=1 Tax=Acanthoscelides obtectus TaxID=200917 RepID=A0A9P0K8T3_ACAOB|nr:unnamed protein product [Acanthoscelides obtectus]CAK1645708.1 hypothetical protein AOBTE_LOCUS14219 [Acanthoscelides obtectus]
MAGSNRAAGTPCTNRIIIIPQGTIDPKQNTVIHIPRNLDNSAPLLVTPPRIEGGPLSVQLLPDFQDRLSRPGETNGDRAARTGTEPKLCPSERAKRKTGKKIEQNSKAIAVTGPPERFPDPEPPSVTEDTRRICSGVGEQNIKSIKSFSRKQQTGGPVQTQVFSMEAPEGISEQAMDRIIWESNQPGYDYSVIDGTLRAPQQFQQNWNNDGFQPGSSSIPQQDRLDLNFMLNQPTPSPIWPDSGVSSTIDPSKCNYNGNSIIYQTAQMSHQSDFFPQPPPAAPSTSKRNNVTYKLPDISTMYEAAQNITPPPVIPASCRGFLAATNPPPPKPPCNPECGGDCSLPGDDTPQPPDSCVPCFDLTQQSVMMSQQQKQCICPPPMPPQQEQYVTPYDEAIVPPPEQYGHPSCDEVNMSPPEQYGCLPCDEANLPPPEQYECPPCDEANMLPPEQYWCPPCDEANLPPPEQYGCPPCDEANMSPPEQNGCPPCDEPEPEPEPCKPTCGGECNRRPPQGDECCPPCDENQQQMMAPPTNTGQRVPNCPQDFNTDMYSVSTTIV